MDSSCYRVSPRVLGALGVAPPAPSQGMTVFSVREESALRRNFLAGAKGFAAAAPAEGGGIAMYSPAFYAACTVGGVLSCGLTHTLVTPLDVVKCNMQARQLWFASSRLQLSRATPGACLPASPR